MFYYIIYTIKFAKFGKNSIIYSPSAIDGWKNISIGNNVNIAQLGWLAAVPHTNSVNCNLSINDNTYIGRFCHIYATFKIEIGKNVLIADKVYISDNSHNYLDINVPIIKQKIIQLNAVEISEGSWIGENVCIIGANIGKNCVVAANSVVKNNVPDYCVAAGAPAIIIKRYNFETESWQKTDKFGNFI